MARMSPARKAAATAKRILDEMPIFWQEVLGSEDSDWMGSVRTDLRTAWAEMFELYARKAMAETLELAVRITDTSDIDDEDD